MSPQTSGSGSAASERRTIAVVASAHGCSHFFHLIVAPLFPWIKTAFDLSYAELGLLMTVFFVVSGVGQALAGFLVDRVGAVPVMLGALSSFMLSTLVIASAPSYGVLMAGCVLAGLGNAPFHPVDYSILNARISAPRLAKAYAMHGIAGSLGWALAPVFLVGITGLAHWRVAVLAAGALPALAFALVWSHRHLLAGQPVDLLGRPVAPTNRPVMPAQTGTGTALPASSLAFLKLPAVWLSFAFFLTSALGFGGIQTFGPEAARLLHDVPVAWVALCLTAFMLASAGGTLIGGFVAANPDHAERIVALGFSLAACVSLVIALSPAPGWMVPGLFALMGLGFGTAGPARDLLVRKASPPGATGRVYGLVYSGLDTGLAISPAVFGTFMDGGHPAWVWLGIAVFQVLLIANALSVAYIGRRSAGAAAQRPA
jgi:FSR family fosmidomycin resistance protein-like MFS transporter